MDHAEALRSKAVEKYLLGELSGEAREAFEEHYFGCAECALDVRAGAAFLGAARGILAHESAARQTKERVSPSRPGWFGWLARPAVAIPVFAALLLVSGYQNLVTIPHMKHTLLQTAQPQPLLSFSLINQESRGSSPLVIRVPAGQPFSLYLDIPPDKTFPAYLCQVEGESGAPEFSVRVSAAEAKNTVELLIPGTALRPGRYSLVVRGLSEESTLAGAESIVARFVFTLEQGR